MEKLFTEIKNIVVTGKHAEIEALVERAIADGANLDELINKALIAAMDVVGQHDDEKRTRYHKAAAKGR
jgi:methanogenic corrinoid protein MtbC1